MMLTGEGVVWLLRRDIHVEFSHLIVGSVVNKITLTLNFVAKDTWIAKHFKDGECSDECRVYTPMEVDPPCESTSGYALLG
jgi:hypothetical protein